MHGLRNLSQKVRFVKIISLFVSLSFARFHRETTLRRPRELPDTAQIEKVLFVNICHRHWLSSARGFPREFPSGHSGTSGTAIPLPLGCPALRDPRNARGVLGRTLRFRPRVSPRLYTLPPTLYTQKSQNFNIFCDSICSYQKNVVYLRL